jgi:hypothetical protein
MNKKSNSILILLVVYILNAGCDNPNIIPGTAGEWQKNMSEALIPSYSSFKAHWVDSDIAAYIFSYRCPPSLSGRDVFSILKKQIPNFKVQSQSDSILVLTYPLTYSGPGGFDEWRFYYDQNSGIMTVLFANLDSPVERKAHQLIIRTLESYHKKEIKEGLKH